MATSLLAEKLIQIPICRGLTEAEVMELGAIAEELSVPKGQYLFQEGEAGDGLYVLLEGSVEVLKRDSGGSNQVLAKVGDGSIVGEMSLLNGNAPRSASALAATNVKLLKLSAARFSNLLRNQNIAALKVVHNFAQVMSRRLLLMDEKLIDLVDKNKRREELADFQKILNKWEF